jgi:hypothetical protein
MEYLGLCKLFCVLRSHYNYSHDETLGDRDAVECSVLRLANGHSWRFYTLNGCDGLIVWEFCERKWKVDLGAIGKYCQSI